MWRQLYSAIGNQWPLLVCILVLVVVFSAAAPRTFPTLLNLQAIAFQLPEVGLLSLGVMLTMVAAGIDLSVVAIADLSGLAAAEFLHAFGFTAGGADSVEMTAVAVVIALTVGAACGALNGLVISRVGVTPILATLATASLFQGIAMVWTGGYSVVSLPGSLRTLGRPMAFGIPVPIIVFAAAVIAVAVLLTSTTLGFQIRLVGANSSASRFAGIHVSRVIVETYVTSGLLAGIAGVMVIARSGSATPDYGQSYVLLSIVIVVLGGVDLAGGYASVAGLTLAAICVAIVQSGFTHLGVNQYIYQAVQGLILAAVVGVRLISGRDVRLRLRRVAAVARPEALGAELAGGDEIAAESKREHAG
jgi:simple sugar transport system permease protein